MKMNDDEETYTQCAISAGVRMKIKDDEKAHYVQYQQGWHGSSTPEAPRRSYSPSAAPPSLLEQLPCLGTDGATKLDEFSEKIQTTLDPPHFRKIIMQFLFSETSEQSRL